MPDDVARKRDIVIVCGDSFADQSPRWRPEAVRKRIEELLSCAKFEKTEAQQLNEGFDGVDPSERLAQRVSEALGTPYHVSIERNVCRRTYDMTVACRSCRAYWHGDIDELALDDRPRVFDEYADIAIAAVLKARAVDDVDESKGCFCVDRYMPSRCLEAWRANVAAYDSNSELTTLELLTDRQVEVARRMWSQQLRAKQRDAAERERNRVLVDIQEEE